MPENYYDILGVSKEASEAEIKAAYRKLALEHHPDRGGGQTAETKFKKINEAYQVLSDPNRRAQYDRFGQAGQAGASGAGNPFGGTDFGGVEFNFGGGGLGDLFENFFGQAFSTVQAE